jgi:hypothetical protein
MSFIARLYIEKEEAINVLQCGFRFRQSLDVSGRPGTLPRGGIIRLVLESDDRTGLFEWMISSINIKNGMVTFYRHDTMSRLKSLHFRGAHCVEYYETFDQVSRYPMQIQLTLSAHSISLNGATYFNDWRM